MELATHQLQGSYSDFPTLPSSWSRGTKLKHSVPRFHAIGSKNRIISLKCRPRSSVGPSLVLGPKSKVFKISAFKGSNRYDDSGIEAGGSKSMKNSVKVPYLQNRSEESSMESSKVQNGVSAPYTSADKAATASLAVQNIFKNWLVLLRAPSQTQAVEEIIEDPYCSETSERPNASQTQERGVILKAVSCYFLNLDATIKIPFLLFTAVYLAVNLVHGPKVSKELVPLWILGPLSVAFYIKMFRSVSGLYAFSFKQTAKIIKNLPAHYSLVHDYIVHGKVKEAMRTHIFKPLADIKDTGYYEVAKRKMKDFQMWLVEIYLNFLELIWPSYCRTVRFLKRANLI